jgi:motility quorum-sensing regulator / GCU-specific mRNA interferase toxin
MKSTTKRKPHYDLTTVKAMVRAGDFRITATAADTARELGIMGKKAVADVLLTMSSNNFHKSITSNDNNKEWQDVYHPMIGTKKGYVKFTVRSEILILSFKEKSEW